MSSWEKARSVFFFFFSRSLELEGRKDKYEENTRLARILSSKFGSKYSRRVPRSRLSPPIDTEAFPGLPAGSGGDSCWPVRPPVASVDSPNSSSGRCNRRCSARCSTSAHPVPRRFLCTRCFGRTGGPRSCYPRVDPGDDDGDDCGGGGGGGGDAASDQAGLASTARSRTSRNPVLVTFIIGKKIALRLLLNF